MDKVTIKRLWYGFWQVADPKIWVASTVPMLVGGALAYRNKGVFAPGWFLLSLLGIYLIEIGKNAINEVVDYRTGVDRFVTPDKRTPFSGGKKTIVDGKLTPAEAMVIGILTTGAACLIGLGIVLYREPNVIWIGIAGVALSVIYSVPPVKLAYRGLGEFTVGLTFGPLILSGMYIVLTGSIDWKAVLVALPIGFLIANVLWINQYPDYEADKKGGKMNWVVRLGKKKAVKGYAALFLAAYATFPLIAVTYMDPFWLLGLITAPLAYKAVKNAKLNYDDIQKLTYSNAATIKIYLLTGILMSAAALMGC
jgi:1,4-dihydroxy-2-naphthoate octaprenyltransferase